MTHIEDDTSWPLNLPAEPSWGRWFCVAAVLVILAGAAALAAAYWVPAHGGVDQNGYLAGGRVLVERGLEGLRPRNAVTGQYDPYQYVGRMWVGVDLGTPRERFYPKYPVGLPAIYGGLLLLGGPRLGPILAYLVSPVGMVLALAGVFFLARLILGSVGAVLVTAVMATSPVTLGLMDNPNSHAVALVFVVWGMYFAFAWWKGGGLWRAVLAGLLAGYAPTVRYTEGLLVLPLALIVVLGAWRGRRSWRQGMILLLVWALPVALLVAYNLLAMGHLTGYDPTAESTGFSWAYFAVNWQTMLRQLLDLGLIFVFPLALLGLLAMLGAVPRLGLVLAAWIVPNLLVYTLYYWAPDGFGIGYLRFFLTSMPALVIAAFWLLLWWRGYLEATGAPLGLRGPWLLFPGGVAALAVALQLLAALPMLESDAAQRVGLEAGVQTVRDQAPPGSVLFTSDTQLLNDLQFAGKYELYDSDLFNRLFVQRLPDMDPDEPQGWQPQRREELYARLKDLDQRALDGEFRGLVVQMLHARRRVFIVQPRRLGLWPLNRALRPGLQVHFVADWDNPWPVESWAPRKGIPRPPRGPRPGPIRPRPALLRAGWALYEVTQ